MPKIVTEDRIVSKKERRTIIPYSDAHYDRLEKAGLVPKRIRLGSTQNSRVGWSFNELMEYVARQKAKRDDPSNAGDLGPRQAA